MLIYQSTKDGFLADNRDRMIEDVVAQGFLDRTGRYAQDATGTLQIERGNAGTDALIISSTATLKHTTRIR